MMNVYSTARLPLEAEKLFETMQSDGVPPDSFTYLALVRAYTEGLKYAEAEEAIMSMRKKGIPPSCDHYNLLLLAFAKAGLTNEAESVFDKIIAAGLSPDLACYRSLLRGYMDYGHVEQGIGLYERIKEFVKADRFIMSAAVHMYKSAGMEHVAQDVLSSMNSLGISFLENLEVGLKTRIT